MNLLDKYLWKPATDIKPEELIGKQCRLLDSKIPVIVKFYKGYGWQVLYIDQFLCGMDIELSDIQFLDESPEAVKEAIKEQLEKAYHAGNLGVIGFDQYFKSI